MNEWIKTCSKIPTLFKAGLFVGTVVSFLWGAMNSPGGGWFQWFSQGIYITWQFVLLYSALGIISYGMVPFWHAWQGRVNSMVEQWIIAFSTSLLICSSGLLFRAQALRYGDITAFPLDHHAIVIVALNITLLLSGALACKSNTRRAYCSCWSVK